MRTQIPIYVMTMKRRGHEFERKQGGLQGRFGGREGKKKCHYNFEK